MKLPCAWCEAESGERTEGSHGICAPHRDKVWADYLKLGRGDASQPMGREL